MTIGFLLFIFIGPLLTQFAERNHSWSKNGQDRQKFMISALSYVVCNFFQYRKACYHVARGTMGWCCTSVYILTVKKPNISTARPVCWRCPYILVLFFYDDPIIAVDFHNQMGTASSVLPKYSPLILDGAHVCNTNGNAKRWKRQEEHKRRSAKEQVMAQMTAPAEIQVADTQVWTYQAERRKTATRAHDMTETQSQWYSRENASSESYRGLDTRNVKPVNFINQFSRSIPKTRGWKWGGRGWINKDIEDSDLIAADIKQNWRRFLYHGKRADGYRKGHASTLNESTGQTKPTDIHENRDDTAPLLQWTWCEREYLRHHSKLISTAVLENKHPRAGHWPRASPTW